MKKWWIILGIVSLFLIPFVSANLVINRIPGLYGRSSLILLIPVIFIEALIAYSLIKRYYGGIGFWYSFLIFSVANITSFIIGFINSSFLYEHSYGGIFSLSFITSFFALFVATLVIEMIVIYLFIRKIIEKPFDRAFIISLIVNLISYSLLFIFIVISFNIGGDPEDFLSRKLLCLSHGVEILSSSCNIEDGNYKIQLDLNYFGENFTGKIEKMAFIFIGHESGNSIRKDEQVIKLQPYSYSFSVPIANVTGLDKIAISVLRPLDNVVCDPTRANLTCS